MSQTESLDDDPQDIAHVNQDTCSLNKPQTEDESKDDVKVDLYSDDVMTVDKTATLKEQKETRRIITQERLRNAGFSPFALSSLLSLSYVFGANDSIKGSQCLDPKQAYFLANMSTTIVMHTFSNIATAYLIGW
eukprot:CAMPEP_0114330116 /NCGR_PEP_ID=MMETSP0101-20121206/1540_1 /TAXON_ID=38822 ORGANISM="Pteridomonas danica, Strain PT" /NCGR_SAMPLE_ID=MMETSP0101 /ASSEMBLY_ACC=CAM_ASM_000211 /LENGTH=133 /DNA_ID=CAMNT_0001460027 /DNA_START=464 /DNA_END=862 /DNA_ORIENTATION=+